MKNKKIIFCLLSVSMFIGVFFFSFGIAKAETCSGECVQGSVCPINKKPTYEEGCKEGNICCKAIDYLGSGSGWNVGDLGKYGLPSGRIAAIVMNVLKWILGLFGFLGVLGFVISGIFYLLSAGDDERMKTAKKAMNYSIIGVLVGLSGVVVIMAIDALLNVSSNI